VCGPVVERDDENCKDAVVIDRKSTEAYTATVQVPTGAEPKGLLHAYMP